MNRLFALVFALGVTLCTTATAHAQGLKFNVPFEFVVNGKTLPASTYIVQESVFSNNAGIAFLGEHQGALATAAEIDTAVTGAKLVFRKIGDEYVLSDFVNGTGKLHFAVSRKGTQRAQDGDRQSLATVNAD